MTMKALLLTGLIAVSLLLIGGSSAVSLAAAEEPADPQDVRREGAAYNANFHTDGVDDYRVDANIAIFDKGMWKAEELPTINAVHRVDCVNPDPLREWDGTTRKYEGKYTPPDTEGSDWRPDTRLNESGKLGPYGCLEEHGEPFPDQLNPTTGGIHGVGVAERAAEIDGIAGLGGVASGARIWSVRVLAQKTENFGVYPDPTSTPVTLDGAGLGTFTTNAAPFECGESSLQGTMSQSETAKPPTIRATQLDLAATYGECTYDEGVATTTVAMNSCHYTLGVKNESLATEGNGSPFGGTLGVACEKETDRIEYEVHFLGKVRCRAKIKPQAGLEGISLNTVGEVADEVGIEATGEAEGVEYEFQGELCGSKENETRTDGTISVNSTLLGSRETEPHVGVLVAGEESAEEAKQPRFDAHLEYLPQLATDHLIAGIDWVIATREDEDPNNDIDVLQVQHLCAQKGNPEVEERGLDYIACDDTVLNEAIEEAIDKGIVVVAAGLDNSNDTGRLTPQSNPDVLTVSFVQDRDGKPGGTASTGCGSGDDVRSPVTNFGLRIDLAPAGCGDTGGTSGRAAGAVAALASQCPAHDRAGVEFIEDTLMAEGDTGGIAEGGYEDTDESGDGWKEPLLNLHDEEVFDPTMVGEEPSPEGCQWRSHQAASDVGSDGRADLVAINSEGKGAEVFAGTHQGYETAKPTVSLKGQLDPALKDGTGQYAIDTADVNGDRHADLITIAPGQGVNVYRGNAEGGFGSAVQSLKGVTLDFDGSEGQIEPIAVADVNGDGRADLVAAHGPPYPLILTYPGKEDGTFGEPVFSGLALNSALLDGEGSYFLDVVDVDGEQIDAKEPIDYNARHSYADLVTMNTNGTVYVYKGQSSGKFSTSGIAAASIDPIMDNGKGAEPIGLGDVNRDRRADLLTLQGETLELYKAKADGTFAGATEPYAGKVDSSLMDGKGQEPIGLLDYSRDGLADLVSVTDKGEVLVYPAQRDSSFGEPQAQEGSLPSVRHGGTHEFLAEKPFLRRAGCKSSDCIWQPPTHAPRFDGESYPLSVSGSGFESFTAKSPTATFPVKCKKTSLAGTLSAPATQLALNGEASECTSETIKTTVAMNGCHYTLATQSTGPPYTGTLGVACGKESERIEYEIYFLGKVRCRAKIVPQSGLSGVSLANVGTWAERGIEAKAEVKSVKYEFQGELCGAKTNETRTDGVIAGTTTLHGKTEAGLSAGVYVTGK
jgi:hypothetical protein